jgi:hypothetical protein
MPGQSWLPLAGTTWLLHTAKPGHGRSSCVATDASERTVTVAKTAEAAARMSRALAIAPS